MRSAMLVLLGILAISTSASAEPAPEHDSCPTSSVVWDTAPRDRAASRVGPADWYINADRTVWAGAVPQGGWWAGERLKTYWVRPQGTQLVISGRRLDATAPPVQAHIPCCYPTGFQIVALQFPTEGCWEVHAKAGDGELRFVTRVKPVPRTPIPMTFLLRNVAGDPGVLGGLDKGR